MAHWNRWLVDLPLKDGDFLTIVFLFLSLPEGAMFPQIIIQLSNDGWFSHGKFHPPAIELETLMVQDKVVNILPGKGSWLGEFFDPAEPEDYWDTKVTPWDSADLGVASTGVWGVPFMGDPHSWMVEKWENPMNIWMRTGGTLVFGNLHIYVVFYSIWRFP